MKKLLEEIQDGSFAKKFIEENETGRHQFARIRQEEAAHGIEKVGADLRKAMPFLDPVKVVDGTVVKKRDSIPHPLHCKGAASKRQPFRCQQMPSRL